jgi:hypothetical protein
MRPPYFWSESMSSEWMKDPLRFGMQAMFGTGWTGLIQMVAGSWSFNQRTTSSSDRSASQTSM